MTQNLRATELKSLTELEAISDQWRGLALAAQHQTPYVLPELMLPVLRRSAGRYACRVVTVWDEQTLVGLAPMFEQRVGRLGIELSIHGFPEIVPAPPCDVLVRQGAMGVEQALLAHWLAKQDWDVVEFANVPRDSPVLSKLSGLASQAGLVVTNADGLDYHYVEVGGPWSAYLAERSKKMRQNLRRGLRYCERFGAVTFPVYPGDLTLSQAMERIAFVLERSWKNDTSQQGWNEFPLELATRLDHADLLVIGFLEVAGEPAAYLLDVPFKGGVYAIHNAYDLKFHLGNPGQLMIARSIERAHNERATCYVTGNRDYLRHWSRLKMPTSRTRLRRRSLLTAAKLAAYDWVHQRREQAALREVELQKDERKDAARMVDDEQ